ncbi:MAG: AI-2E family transporter [Pirellulales bacterium]|nr:AI-2E family transporter [Pirellulales bacterium]
MMPRLATLLVLVCLVALFGYLFYQVMAGFLMPLFLALLCAILFEPLHEWVLSRCRGYRYLSASLVTFLVFLMITVPLLITSASLILEARQLVENPQLFIIDPRIMETGVAWVNKRFSLELTAAEIQQVLYTKTRDVLGPIAAATPMRVLDFLVGLSIMLIGLFYFLLDGQRMIAGVRALIPLDEQYQSRLIHEFASISRAVAAATLLSALGQGLLAGIGYYFAGLPSLTLLIIATILTAVIPFVGASIIWFPAALWLIFIAEKFWPGVFLIVYGGAVVSLVDNLIKPLVLQGRTNLHPLLALLSVLGGVQVLGMIGLFVGPMTVVFLQAALTMLQSELGRGPVETTTLNVRT